MWCVFQSKKNQEESRDVLHPVIDWNQIVGVLSQWINPDSTNAQLREDSSMAIKQELEWAQHLSLQAVMLSELSSSGGVANTARILFQVSVFLKSIN